MGIRADRAVNYHADRRGTSVVYDAVSDTILHARVCGTVPENWRRKIDEDNNSR